HPSFGDRVEHLLDAITAQPGARLPGERRLTARAHARAHGVGVPADVLNDLLARVSPPHPAS
ncbi:MAG TPA: hypothetical protein VND92_08700, partial [Vicinamibacterales bacterium]|nr:hypothetical protein [Vicinamibacterales bacterium]